MAHDALRIVELGHLADIRLGHPFRGPVREVANGEVAVVQLKNADPDRGVDWPALVRTTLFGRKQPDWLQTDDVLFAARGNRNLALHMDEVPGPAVCAPQFYLLRVRSENVLPAYLTWYLNQQPAQRYFAQSAEGTLITSIRRPVLEALPIPVPRIDRQHLIARLNNAVSKEKRVTEQLLRNREQQLRLVATGLIE